LPPGKTWADAKLVDVCTRCRRSTSLAGDSRTTDELGRGGDRTPLDLALGLDGRDDAMLVVVEDESAGVVVDVMVRLLIPADAATALVDGDAAAALKQVNGLAVVAVALAFAVCGRKRCHHRDAESRQVHIEMGSLLGSSFPLTHTLCWSRPCMQVSHC
jgi:hypothetical protein